MAPGTASLTTNETFDAGPVTQEQALVADADAVLRIECDLRVDRLPGLVNRQNCVSLGEHGPSISKYWLLFDSSRTEAIPQSWEILVAYW
jgi:hypothetical protein